MGSSPDTGYSPISKWTIGYGHTDDVNQGMLITEKTAIEHLCIENTQLKTEVQDLRKQMTRELTKQPVPLSFSL